jgi:hypothetical protein
VTVQTSAQPQYLSRKTARLSLFSIAKCARQIKALRKASLQEAGQSGTIKVVEELISSFEGGRDRTRCERRMVGPGDAILSLRRVHTSRLQSSYAFSAVRLMRRGYVF